MIYQEYRTKLCMVKDLIDRERNNPHNYQTSEELAKSILFAIGITPENPYGITLQPTSPTVDNFDFSGIIKL